MFVDSHCHLDRLDLTPYEGNLDKAIQAAHERGVTRMLCVGIDMNNASDVIDIAARHDGIYASVGVHPMDINDTLVDRAVLIEMGNNNHVVAIGETGLDYYYEQESAELQKQSFRLHLEVAAELAKPVIVHTRNAREDTLAIIREAGSQELGGVLHCFTESWDMAKQALDMNYMISFSGIITFKNAAELREVVKQVPLDRLLIETDSPYLAPVPWRGKKNEPRFVVEVAQCVAELKGVDVEEVADVTARNFDRLFMNSSACAEV